MNILKTLIFILVILLLISNVYSEIYQGSLRFSDLYNRDIAEIKYKVIIENYAWNKKERHREIEKIIITIKNLDNSTVLNAPSYFPNLWYEKVDYPENSGKASIGMCVWIPDQSPLNPNMKNKVKAEEYMIYPQKIKEYTLTYKEQYIIQSYGNKISYSLFCDKLLKGELDVFIGISPDMKQKPFKLQLNKLK